MSVVELEGNEKIIQVVHRHPFFFLMQAGLLAVVGLLPLWIYSFAKSQIIFTDRLNLLCEFLYTIWVLIVWIIIFIAWTDFYLDAWIITNKRLIDIEQKG